MFTTVTGEIHNQLLHKTCNTTMLILKIKLQEYLTYTIRTRLCCLSKITTKMILVIASNAHMSSGESKIITKMACSWCDQNRY